MTTAGMRVVATAGHVDHGKSSLVLALTGTDPDRWREEKERGLTIDLGFAFTTLPSGLEVGFVDVPGHVRFLKNMLAGVGAVRAAVLVVAATEGWMPQTEEHLRILELLGIDRGFTVVSKADLVDDETLELAQLEVAEQTEGTFLADAPVVVCDSLSGRGLDEVRAGLDRLVESLPAHEGGQRPRLWVDRVFSARGAGTVVTGTLTGGALDVDDEVLVGPAMRRARVRGVQSGHVAADRALPGTRVALNLSGVDREDVRRGDAVVVAGQWVHTEVVDADVTVLPGERLRRRARLKAYVGSGEYDVVVRRIDDRFGRVFLPTALPLTPGDRMVLRDPGPDLTVGGATIVDVAPALPARKAASALRLPPGQRVLASRQTVDIARLAALVGSDTPEAEELADRLVAEGHARRADDVLVDAARAAEAIEVTAAAVDRLHAERPLEAGLDLAVAADRAGLDPDVLRALLDQEPGLDVEQGRVRRPGHRVDVLADPAAKRYLAALDESPYAPPAPEETGTPAEVVRALERAGLVVETEGVRFSRAALDEAVRRVALTVTERGAVTVADVRDVLGTSRKYLLPILAATDGRGVTRRRGDERIPGPLAAEAAGQDPARVEEEPGGP